MKAFAAVILVACSAMLSGCAYTCSGSHEAQPYCYPVNHRPEFPNPERPWNYSWEWPYRRLEPGPIAVPIIYE